jgi:hypothetical protein
MEVGQIASHDFAFPTGWHSIAAVRKQGSLLLYLDGELVARAQATVKSLNLDTGVPLRIGFGRHEYFSGRMRDLRMYQRALSAEEIDSLAKESQSSKLNVATAT